MNCQTCLKKKKKKVHSKDPFVITETTSVGGLSDVTWTIDIGSARTLRVGLVGTGVFINKAEKEEDKTWIHGAVFVFNSCDRSSHG